MTAVEPISDAPGAPTDLEWGDGWVRRGDRSSGFTAPKNQAMFRVLVEARGNVVHYDTLQDRLWPDDTAPRQVRNCLQAYASHLRRTLAPLGVEVGSVRDRGYRLVDLEHRSNGSGQSEVDAAEISAVRDRLATERAYSLSVQRQWADERRVYLRLAELVRGQMSLWEGSEVPEGWDPDKVMRDLAECLAVLDRSVGPEGSDDA